MTAWPTLLSFLALCIPLAFALGAVLAPLHAPLRSASAASLLAAGLALVVAAGSALAPSSAAASDLARWVRLDVATSVMLVLVCTIAAVIVRYSRSYLHRDPGERRYGRALMATLAAVTTLVLSNDLLVIAAAWMATSMALHHLLTFFPDRTPALVAAHKKFLLSRFADVCVLAALVLLGLAVGSLDLDDLQAWVRARTELPLSVHAAAVLLVVAVCLRSAQLPFHGWLTQVMEAPTPVSALLHAGIVNIGGFLMIRLAPLMAHAHAAQLLLVIVGITTTVVAALVMTTRVSVKVSLAWSTIAQMGFMLVQCGLGLWHLALLHLVAHSLYKAHAFLGSGSTVDGWRVQAIGPRRAPVSATRMLAAAAIAVAGVTVLGVLLGARDPALAPLAIILGLSLAPLLARADGHGRGPLAVVAVGSVGVVLLTMGWHALAEGLLARPVEPALGIGWRVVGGSAVVGGFLLLFGLQVALQARPDGELARALRPRLFAGLYLDEIFTRLTFRWWPPKLPPTPVAQRPLRLPKTVET